MAMADNYWTSNDDDASPHYCAIDCWIIAIAQLKPVSLTFVRSIFCRLASKRFLHIQLCPWTLWYFHPFCHRSASASIQRTRDSSLPAQNEIENGKIITTGIASHSMTSKRWNSIRSNQITVGNHQIKIATATATATAAASHLQLVFSFAFIFFVQLRRGCRWLRYAQMLHYALLKMGLFTFFGVSSSMTTVVSLGAVSSSIFASLFSSFACFSGFFLNKLLNWLTMLRLVLLTSAWLSVSLLSHKHMQ